MGGIFTVFVLHVAKRVAIVKVIVASASWRNVKPVANTILNARACVVHGFGWDVLHIPCSIRCDEFVRLARE